MSVSLTGESTRLGFKVHEECECSFHGRGLALVSLLTGPSQPPDALHEVSAAWQVDTISASGKPPTYLSDAITIPGVSSAVSRAAGRDVLIVTATKDDPELDIPDRPVLSVFVLLQPAKFQAAQHLLLAARPGPPFWYSIDSSGVAIADSPATSAANDRLPGFRTWQKLGTPIFVAGNIELSIRPIQQVDVTSVVSAELLPIRRAVIASLVVGILGLLIHISTRW